MKATRRTKLKSAVRAMKPTLSVSAAVLYALYGGRLYAADDQSRVASSEQGGDVLAEVTVTARRREENAQDVPVSVTVLSPSVLQENNVQSMEDLQALSPSLSFVATQDRDNPTVTIRGQGPSPGAGPSVVFYLDEVPMPINQATGSAIGGPGFFYDLEDIQVLKGPQGTLFGRNTTGGAVLVQSARPKDDVEGNLQLAYGNYDDRELDGVFNAPIIDHTLLARVAVSWQERNGFTNQIGEPDRPLDNTDRQSFRVTLTYKPVESVQNDLIYNYADIKSNGTSAILSAVNPTLAVSEGYPTLPALLAEQQALGARTELKTDFAPYMERDYVGITDIFRFDLTPNVTFKNIFGYSLLHYRLGVDWDGTDLPLYEFDEGNPAAIHYNTYTEEPQFQGTALNGNLTWDVGSFYLNSPPGAFGASVTSILGAPDRLLTRLGSRSEAVYTQETYDLSSLAEGLKITGGYRYTWDYAYAQERGLTLAGTCPPGSANNCYTTGSANFSSPTWDFDIDYKLTHDILFYISAKKGYRDGGFNTNSSIATSVSAFGPEHLTDFELGTKAEWEIGGVRARTNADIYIDNYQGIQVPVDTIEDGTIVQLTQNAANARITGTEFEGLIFPTDNFQIGATGSWINFAYTSSTGGAQLSQAHEFPKWKYSVNSKYKLPVASTLGDISVNANWSWQSNSYIGPYGDPVAVQTAYGLLNLGANWNHINGTAFDVSLFMTNALNKLYAINDFAAYNLDATDVLTYGLPRMYGVRVNYRFGASQKRE
jgi:iron complex outermembrane recepter protein